MIHIKTALELDSEQFEKWTDFLTWLKTDKEMKNQEHDSFSKNRVGGWLPYVSDTYEKFVESSRKNCKCRFDDGSIRNYNDKMPIAVMTHFWYDK